MKTSLEIEIEQLIQKLQKEAKENGHVFEEEIFFEEQLAENKWNGQNVENRVFIPDSQLHYEHPLQSSRRSIYKAVIFLKRLIRKCNRFLIVPILDEQSGFNYSVKAEINRLNKKIELQEKRIKELEWYRKELS